MFNPLKIPTSGEGYPPWLSAKAIIITTRNMVNNAITVTACFHNVSKPKYCKTR